MGTYLSTPVRDKESKDYEGEHFSYGASSMQGWRMSQEDAHSCQVDFDPDMKTSLFAVYDGHGGAEVAQYTAMHFPDYLKKLSRYSDGHLSAALEEAFLGFDATLTEEDVVRQLRDLAGLEQMETDEVDEEVKHEAVMLREEATMPIEKLLERYGGAGCVSSLTNKAISSLSKTKKFQSPMIRKKADLLDQNGDDAEKEEGNKEEKENSDDVKMKLEEKLMNGCCDEKSPETDGLLDCKDVTVNQSSIDCNSSKSMSESDATCTESSKSVSEFDMPCVESSKSVSEFDTPCVESSKSVSESDSSSIETPKNVPESDTTCAESSESMLESVTTCAESSKNVSEIDVTFVESSKNSQIETKKEEESASVTSERKDELGPECSSSKSTEQAGKSGTEIDEDSEEDSNEDEDDDSDDEEKWNSEDNDSDDDDDDDDDELGGFSLEDGEDEDDEEDGCRMTTAGEEPGADSGCTAVVAILRGRELFVANAGDSRCIVCRAGHAIDMSIDHKPEDTIESNRITKAGGRVTCDGRVNGGLNLSRAIGDHSYKQNDTLSLREQMITSLPDVKSLTLNEDDRFMVLACDGIWNVMSSQDVVDFVQRRLDDGVKKLSVICEELFDFCLAPDTAGDGTGCDNMTCVIVTFNKLQSNFPYSTKRKSDNDCEEESSAKRPKEDEQLV